MKKYILMILAGLLTTSCLDTVILPDNKTVDEDYWKTKSDVQAMVTNAYKSMIDADVVTRLIVWGDMRSDELLPTSTGINTSAGLAIQEDLNQLNTANTQYDNTFATWADFYSVINNCNIVLKKASAVMEVDPSYTQGDYLADCSQMLALRSLCYFYLVRNFRDVPYTTEAFMTSSQDFNVPQVAPETVLRNCIEDLKTAEGNSLLATAYTDWRRVGYFNRDGIDALLSDIYLWLGSVNHSKSDYEQAVVYADKVIASKQAQHTAQNSSATDHSVYPLAEGRDMFDQLFITQNAEESIFELQFDGSSNKNTSAFTYLNSYNGSTNNPYLEAPGIFGKGSQIYTTGTNVADYRGLLNTFSSTEENYKVRKMVTNVMYSPSTTTGAQVTKTTSTTYDHNYIIYRLSDVMLMKAEALVSMADSTTDAGHLRPAFNLVQAVNTRAIENKTDSIKWNTYSNQEKMESLVLAERLREFAFEGKRWYDLLRYNYRHVTGVDYSTMLYQQQTFVETYSPMLNLLIRKFSTGGNAISAKLSTEPMLYLPVPKSDMQVCKTLVQNPGYSTSSTYEKNK